MTRSYSDRQRTASFLKASLSTNCVLLESRLANGLRPSSAQARRKECASLRQDARSALRSGKLQGVRFAQASCKECASLRQAARSALRSGKLQGVRFAQPVGEVVPLY